jgi:hypothetical protein
MRFVWCLFALGSSCLAQPAVAPAKPPRVLLQILHCREADKFGVLDSDLKKGQVLKASFTRYVQSEPAIEGFVLVIYESNTKGDVFDFIRKFEHGKVWFYLVNNASFSLNQNNVLSVDDALGGVWIQGHLKQRVKKAMRNTYSIPVESLVGPFQNVGCHAYWDPD